MLVDANLLVYAVLSESPFHERAKGWWEAALSGTTRVGLPWPSLLAFLRLVTNPRVVQVPLPMTDAWGVVDEWLEREVVWVPQPTRSHRDVLGGLLTSLHIAANHVPDAHLASLAIEHGVTLYSNDSDFARFTGLRWTNPLA